MTGHRAIPRALLLAMFAGLGPASAWAVPSQFTHQGRIVDGDGLPLDGDVAITFRLHTEMTDESSVWEETHDLSLTNGFYSAVLGADVDGNPLDIDVLGQEPLWLETQIDDAEPMMPRHPVGSVPYAAMAAETESVAGGPVDAVDVAIAGSAVIDGEGRWVGPTPSIEWADIVSRPAGFGDGVDDVLSPDDVLGAIDGNTVDLGDPSTLGGVALVTTDDLSVPTWDTLDGIPDDFLDGVDNDSITDLAVSCIDGDAPHWNGLLLEWECIEDVDTVLSPETVESVVTAGAIDLATGSSVGGEVIATGAHTAALDWSAITGIPGGFGDGFDDDHQLSAADVIDIITGVAMDLAADTTLGGLAIATGEHITDLDWSAITDVPEGFADGIDDDHHLSEGEVIAMVESGPMDIATDSTLGGQVIATGADLPSGTVAIWQGSSAPDGWDLCDGSGGTPDLRARFVVGAGGSYGVGNTGGGPRSVSSSTGSAKHHGTSGLSVVTSVSAGSALPPYYALSYIMKR